MRHTDKTQNYIKYIYYTILKLTTKTYTGIQCYIYTLNYKIHNYIFI